MLKYEHGVIFVASADPRIEYDMSIVRSLPWVPEMVTNERCFITSSLGCTYLNSSWGILDGGKDNRGQVGLRICSINSRLTGLSMDKTSIDILTPWGSSLF